MCDMERLQSLLNDSDGILTANEVALAGIHHQYLTRMLEQGKLEKSAHGIYLTPQAFEDKMYVLQCRRKNMFFSHDTALFLHDLTDRDPLSYCVTVPSGYNTKKLISEGLTVFSVRKELFTLGASYAKTIFGRQVQVYNMERTICDILRSRTKMDIAIISDAIKRYARRKDKNITILMEYAKAMHVEKLVRNYMEVLL